MEKLTLGFTGEIVKDLAWGENENDKSCKLIKNAIAVALINYIEKGYCLFMGGITSRCDLYIAEIIIELRRVYKEITLEIALPYSLNKNEHCGATLKRYKKIMTQADKFTFTSDIEIYFSDCLRTCNQYIIKNSDELFKNI